MMIMMMMMIMIMILIALISCIFPNIKTSKITQTIKYFKPKKQGKASPYTSYANKSELQ
jgi:sortase (surface protein transpeptidase)